MSENTKIVQCYLPPMVAGKYTVETKQKVVKKDKTVLQSITKVFDVGVDAARFTLNATDIYSVYPPANKSGNYLGTLPNVVFSRRTLPWERTIDGKPPVFQRKANLSPMDFPPVPWMALLLFDEDEMKDLRINISTLNDILPPNEPDDIVRPEIFPNTSNKEDVLKLMGWEQPTDGCFTIDITKEQFEEQVPSMASLSYLAHAKEVSIIHKDKEGILDSDEYGETGTFAVLAGNKLPAPKKSHTAVVVSLEGYIHYLDGATAQKTIPNDHKVRLVALANWNFDNSGETTFLELVNGIETKSMKIINPNNETAELQAIFDSGYTAMGHLTRVNAKTVSWYHGPFVPKLSPANSKKISFSSSDSALRYDKSTGLFDVSFAAAWQLGRILALQNKEYAKAMLNWRIAQKQSEASSKQQKTIDDIIGITEKDKNIPVKDKVIQYLGNLHNLETVSSVSTLQEDTSSEIPKEVITFLKELYKLNGVPFSYLVPHEFYLEKTHQTLGKEYSGTLSTFYIDPNWIEALLDGALSIGRIQNTDILLDRLISSGLVVDKYTNQKTGEEEKDNQVLNVTGFLLRSDLVSGWRGLEIEAYDINKKLLPAIRFERINTDIFLGIFHGNIASVTIKQPYEGLHFGIKISGQENGNDTYSKNLKKYDGTNQSSADGTADVDKELDGGLIQKRILNIESLAAVMKHKLAAKDWIDVEKNKGGYFTSAEFAYQMVDSPVKREININIKPN
jgi:hypothetical protein